MLHEFGHLFDNLWSDYFTTKLQKETFTLNGEFFAGWDSTNKSYKSLGAGGDVRGLALSASRILGGDAWQQRGGTAHWEDWADIFSNYISGNLNQSKDLGWQMYRFASEMGNHVTGGGH